MEINKQLTIKEIDEHFIKFLLFVTESKFKTIKILEYLTNNSRAVIYTYLKILNL